jgi:flagellar biosynthesis protein FlhG
MTQSRMTPVYAVASGKGGVGKTSLTLTMATLWAKQGKRVLVVDGDVGLANIDVQLNLKPNKDLGDVLAGKATLLETVVKTPLGFEVVPGRSGHGGLANLPMAAVQLVLRQVRALAPDYDVVLVDVAAGVGATELALCAGCDAVLVITTPDPSAYTDAYALVKLLWKEHGLAHGRVVVNMASAREGADIHKRLAQAAEHFLGLPDLAYAGHVPPCRQYAQAVKLHQLPVVAFPNSPAVVAVGKIIAELLL